MMKELVALSLTSTRVTQASAAPDKLVLAEERNRLACHSVDAKLIRIAASAARGRMSMHGRTIPIVDCTRAGAVPRVPEPYAGDAAQPIDRQSQPLRDWRSRQSQRQAQALAPQLTLRRACVHVIGDAPPLRGPTARWRSILPVAGG